MIRIRGDSFQDVERMVAVRAECHTQKGHIIMHVEHYIHCPKCPVFFFWSPFIVVSQITY